MAMVMPDEVVKLAHRKIGMRCEHCGGLFVVQLPAWVTRYRFECMCPFCRATAEVTEDEDDGEARSKVETDA